MISDRIETTQYFKSSGMVSERAWLDIGQSAVEKALSVQVVGASCR